MKSNELMLTLVALLGVALTTTLHAQSSASTYQGQLTDNGSPANGFFDLTFSVWTSASGPSQVGLTLTNNAVAVSDGLFTVTLDFGPSAFDGSDRWLEIGVATNGSGVFNNLSPRQQITSTPYAIQAANATSADTVSGAVAASQVTGTLSTDNIGDGTITTAKLADGAVGSAQLAPGTLGAPITIAGTSQTAVANTSYVATNDSLTAITLPTTANVGDVVQISAAGTGGWQAYTSPAGETWTPRESTRFWESVASSADGSNLVAVEYGGKIYTSTDGGVSWTARDNSRNWASVASSADGSNLVAGVSNGQLYTSTDSGVSWMARESTRLWQSVASSADGSKLVAVEYGGQIYTSTDSGTNWTARESIRHWNSVASSADGTKLVAAVANGQIYTSTDSGVTWMARESTRNWYAVASSADGTKLVAVEYGGQIYTSTDSGVTWMARESTRNWLAVASSADGTQLVAAVQNGQIYTSVATSVSGAAGTSQQFQYNGNGEWQPVGVDASTIATGTLDPARIPSLDAAKITTGTLAVAQLPTAVVTNGASGVNISGTFSGNGTGVTNVNLLSVNTQGAINFSTTNGIFSLGSSPSVGVGPAEVVAADVNGDGWLDLVNPNAGIAGDGNTLTVLTNNRNGGFVIASSPVVGSAPYSLTAVDVNGDGWVDLVSSSSPAFPSTLTVLTNNGSGDFVFSSSPGVGGRPLSNEAADVNNDGKVDLISANYANDSLTVLTNDGSGGFAQSSSPSVGDGPRSLAVADVNSDGKVDLISANANASTLTVLTNDGTGGFVLSSSPSVGAAPYAVTAADLNSDGKVDLVSADHGDSTLTVLTNDGSGGFALSSSPAVGPQPRWITAADLNADGKMDLVSANLADNTLTVLTNDGNGGFVLSSSLDTGSSPYSVKAADVNGDGLPDLISANQGDNTLTVWFNTTSVSAAFIGDGAGLTSLNASNVTGTLDDAHLSANVALLNRSPQTFTGENDFSSSTQFSERLRLSGQEFYQSGNTDTEGLSLLLGVNRSDNRQLWLADSGRLAVNSSNPVLRMLVSDHAAIDSVATDGTTPLPLSLGPNGSLVLAANGHVGIGTTSPTKGALQVDSDSGVSPAYSQAGYVGPNGAELNPRNVSGGTGVSIWASGWIMGSEIFAFSDERIKNIQGPSDGAADLKTLLGIQITDYTYKDTIAKGTRPQKKVIAQQVEKVYPQAVSRSTGEVPDIYQRAPVKDGWVQLATDLKVGERVKLIGEKEQGVYPVLEVRAGAFRTGFQPKGDKVFVYGRQVDDFRTVDYEAIAMLNVSATQEIYRELTALKAENAELKKKVGRIDELAQKNAAMESRLAALEKLITRQHLALNEGAK